MYMYVSVCVSVYNVYVNEIDAYVYIVHVQVATRIDIKQGKRV